MKQSHLLCCQRIIHVYIKAHRHFRQQLEILLLGNLVLIIVCPLRIQPILLTQKSIKNKNKDLKNIYEYIWLRYNNYDLNCGVSHCIASIIWMHVIHVSSVKIQKFSFHTLTLLCSFAITLLCSHSVFLSFFLFLFPAHLFTPSFCPLKGLKHMHIHKQMLLLLHLPAHSLSCNHLQNFLVLLMGSNDCID